MTDKTYDHNQAEPKWQKAWEGSGLFQNSTEKKTENLDKYPSPSESSQSSNPSNKMYLLFAFAYPSGSGLHVGHVESKTALDILARYYRMNGKDVFFPVGWDAFGLPAENYAIKTGIPPAETTVNAINTFRRQIKRIGISYDWANEIATSHPEYYKWTQWIFLQLFNKGLAYKKGGMVNWCPSCQTVLANEQVVNGTCERCGHEVIQKELDQWYFKITDYKDELIEGLDQVDWPKPTEDQQKHWIGKSEGANVRFNVQGLSFKNSDQTSDIRNQTLTTFTTRVDTIFGVTFLVMSPEKAKEWIEDGWEAADSVKDYLDKSFKKTEEERMKGEKDKTGVDTGLKVINPVNQKEVPVFVADYVLAGYGTGVVMGVPAHDPRDHAFATKHGLEIIQVVDNGTEHDYQAKPISGDGVLVNSGEFDGMTFDQAIQSIPEKFSTEMEKTTTYKLRDWLISRQRYWGAPIPVVYDPEGKPHPVKEEHLPWTLPTDVEFKPTGESPLHGSQELKSRVEELYGKGWNPEYDTMDTFVDSSWYFLRYVDSRNKAEFASKEQLQNWLPVDFYMIGPEHIVLHLLYARFITKFLRDEGYLCEVKDSRFKIQDLSKKSEPVIKPETLNLKPSLSPNDHEAHRKAGLFCVSEPFTTMRHQGMILGPDHRKMSKSKGNVIDPDQIVEKYGADALRMYEMFMGPIDADKPWNERSVVGVRRFLERVWKLVNELMSERVNGKGTHQPINSSTHSLQRKLHQTIKKVTEDIPELKFNTAIASMMEFVNQWEAESKTNGGLIKDDILSFIKLLAPFAPFMAEELYQTIWRAETTEFKSIHQLDWVQWDESKAVSDEILIVVQINGKARDTFELESSIATDEDKAVEAAKDREIIAKWLVAGQLRKTIFIPPRDGKQGLINFVIS